VSNRPKYAHICPHMPRMPVSRRQMTPQIVQYRRVATGSVLTSPDRPPVAAMETGTYIGCARHKMTLNKAAESGNRKEILITVRSMSFASSTKTNDKLLRPQYCSRSVCKIRVFPFSQQPCSVSEAKSMFTSKRYINQFLLQ
jgi:hypothetical protein